MAKGCGISEAMQEVLVGFDPENIDTDLCFTAADTPWTIKRTTTGDIHIANTSIVGDNVFVKYRESAAEYATATMIDMNGKPAATDIVTQALAIPEFVYFGDTVTGDLPHILLTNSALATSIQFRLNQSTTEIRRWLLSAQPFFCGG